MAKLNVDLAIEGSELMVQLELAIGRGQAQAIGHAVMLWARIANERRGGSIDGLSDAMLEKFAGWDGEPGVFARAARAVLADADGALHDWPALFGSYEARRDRNAQVLRDGRAAARDKKKLDGKASPAVAATLQHVATTLHASGPVLSKDKDRSARGEHSGAARAGAGAPRRAHQDEGPPKLESWNGKAEANEAERERIRKARQAILEPNGAGRS